MIDIFLHIAGLLGWSVISLIFGAAIYPLFSKRLPQAVAWPLCRLSAVPLITALQIWPSFFTRVPLTPWLTLLVLAAAGTFAHRITKTDAKENFRAFFAWQNLKQERFLLAIAFCFLLVVLMIPNAGTLGERLRDTAFMVALSTQKVLPIHDPWLSDVKVPYYLLGYVVNIEVFQFLPVSALLRYNLGLAVAPALFAFALQFFFRMLWQNTAYAAVGALVILLGSNFKSVEQALAQVFRGKGFYYWDSSRVIPGTINEFPLWTATFGDLHAHFMALWLLPTLLAVCCCYLKRGETNKPVKFSWPEVTALAYLTSWLFGMNTWEFPIAFGICAATLVWTHRRTEAASFVRRFFNREFLIKAAGYAALTVVLSVPYAFTAATAPKKFLLVETRTEMADMFRVFGLFLIPLILLALKRIYDTQRTEKLAVATLLLVLPFLFNSGGVLLIVVAFLLMMALDWHDENDATILLTAGIGFILCLGCEVLHLKDAFGGFFARMNTVFKFYMPAWTLIGISAVVALRRLMQSFAPTRYRLASRVALAAWTLASASFLLLGIRSRTADFRAPASYDGYGELKAESPDDAALIQWMVKQVAQGELKGNLLEWVDTGYKWPGRAAAFSGLTGFVGWDNYSYWVQIGQGPIHYSRKDEAKRIFDGSHFAASPSCDVFNEKLRKLNIDFFFYGKYERTGLSPYTKEKLENCLRVEHSAGLAKLYSVPGIIH